MPFVVVTVVELIVKVALVAPVLTVTLVRKPEAEFRESCADCQWK